MEPSQGMSAESPRSDGQAPRPGARQGPSASVGVHGWWLPFPILLVAAGICVPLAKVGPWSMLFLSLPLGLAMVHRWGLRVVPAAALAMAATGLLAPQGLTVAPILAMPVVVVLTLSWLLFGRLLHGDDTLTARSHVIGFLVTGLAVPVAFAALLMTRILEAMGQLAPDSDARTWASLTAAGTLAGLAVAVPALGLRVRLPGRAANLWRWPGPDDAMGGGRPKFVLVTVCLVLAPAAVTLFLGLPAWLPVGAILLAAGLYLGHVAAIAATSVTCLVLLVAASVDPEIANSLWRPIARPVESFGLAFVCMVALVAGRTVEDLRHQIAERRRMEGDLVEHRRRLETLLSHLPGAAYRMSGTDTPRLEFVSEGVLDVTGFSAETLLEPPADAHWKLIDSEDLERVAQEMRQAADGEKGFSHEFRIIDAEGRRRWLLDRGTAWHDPDGDGIVVEGFISDVTELKMAERDVEDRLRFEVLLSAASARLVNAGAGAIDSEIQGILHVFGRHLHAARANIFLFVDQNRAVERAYLWRADTDEGNELTVTDRVSANQLPWFFQRALKGEVTCFSRIDELPPEAERERLVAEETGSAAAIQIPIVAEGESLGYLSFVYGEPRSPWTGEEVARLRLVAEVVGNALIRKRSGVALRRSEERYRLLYDKHPGMFLTTDTAGRVLSVNESARDWMDQPMEQIVGGSMLDLVHADDRPRVKRVLTRICASPEAAHLEFRTMAIRGKERWLRAMARAIEDIGEEPLVLVVGEDVTETRELEAELSHKETHDSLTGLPNRLEFEHRLSGAIHEMEATGSTHAVCYVDLDKIRVVNDLCGHIAGDELIRQVAQRLSESVRRGDTLARLGGDEFGLLLKDCSLEDAVEVAEGLQAGFREFAFRWEDRRFDISASMGVAPVNSESGTAQDVLSTVDALCYTAKESGRDRIQVYDTEDTIFAARRSEFDSVASISSAFADDRFELWCQPIAPIGRSEHGDHYEILIRMRGPDGDLVPPGLFLPAAERFDMSGRLDRWVIAETMAWLRAHPEARQQLRMVSINLSGQTMGDDDVLGFILRQFAEGTVSPGKVCFEVTETAAIQNLARATDFIQVLRDQGCRFALDDFGAGMSSFAYLKNLPVDLLKIDGSFIRNIVNDRIDRAMVTSIREIAKTMGKQVVAEFVEDEQILEVLRSIGVDYAQGYHVARPMPIDELLEAPPEETGLWRIDEDGPLPGPARLTVTS